MTEHNPPSRGATRTPRDITIVWRAAASNA